MNYRHRAVIINYEFICLLFRSLNEFLSKFFSDKKMNLFKDESFKLVKIHIKFFYDIEMK